MFIYRFKNCVTVFLSVVLSLALCVGIRYVNVTKLSSLKGERTYYLDSASSRGLQKNTLALQDIFRVRGDSIIMDLREFEGGMYETNAEIAHAIAKQYGATLYQVEEACGVISYYGYTSRWQDGVWVQGELVNLHIAINKDTCVVGTPIIFGGF